MNSFLSCSRFVFFLLAIMFGLLACSNDDDDRTITGPTLVEETASGGEIYTTVTPKATVHTYVASEDAFEVTTQIVETDDGLIVIDAQFLPVHAQEVVDYIATLNKPIRRVYISHEHPDHFAALEVFGNVPVYATEAATDFIATAGQAIIDSYSLGVNVVVPTESISAGTEVIDGVTWEFLLFENSEATTANVVINLPNLGIVIAQDIVYNGTHLFLDGREFPEWKMALAELEGLPGIEVVLGGHGAPTDPSIYASVEEYLTAAEEAFVNIDTFDGVLAQLQALYPDRTSLPLLQIGLGIVYGD